jgi:cation:H+ antiporter
MLLSLVAFAASLAVLLAAARFFTHSAERVGFALGMSPFAIGVLIVSAGTSLPELVASIVAASRGSSEIVVGNVLGANLSNLLLVMGAVAVSARASVRLGEYYILIDQHFLLVSVVLSCSPRSRCATGRWGAARASPCSRPTASTLST